MSIGRLKQPLFKNARRVEGLDSGKAKRIITMTNETRLNADELEVVAVSGPAEAQMIQETLRNNGIDCSLQGNVPSNPWPGTSDLDEVRVLVRQSDVPAANELIDAFYTPVAKSELDEGESDLGVDDPEEPGGFRI